MGHQPNRPPKVDQTTRPNRTPNMGLITNQSKTLGLTTPGTCSTTEAPPLHRHATFFAALVGDPPEDYNSFRRIQNKARFNSTVEPKTDETIDLEKTRSTIRRTSIIFDRSKINRFSDRESIGQRKTKSVDRELDSGLNRRRSRRRNGATRATAFPETKAGETVVSKPPFPGRQKLAIADHRFPESNLLTGDENDRSSGESFLSILPLYRI
ncbi:hypothetical protein YC2023_124247 [Brassica napus]